MTNLVPNPGITSKFVHGGLTYSDVFAIEHSQTQERVDTTGMGQLSEAFVPGRKSVLEITIRFYGSNAASGSFSGTDAQRNLELGQALIAGHVHFSSGQKLAWTTGNANVLSHGTTAGVDGATEHEVTLAVASFDRTYVAIS